MLLIKKRLRIKTTDSDHDLEKYPNQVKELKPERPNQLWVSDLSYIRVGVGFAYLSVIMDAYSRKIVGWSFHKTLEAKRPVAALEMALKTRSQTDEPLIHHRTGDPVGSGQTASAVFNIARESMWIDCAKRGLPLVRLSQVRRPKRKCFSRTGFSDFKGGVSSRGIPTFNMAETAIEQAIVAYNSLRLHGSLGYKTAPAARA
ncbi:DDE-type integrase/transposase/recombinase [Spirosoma foliorum]|uniref:DDE-type integrase/transposase/recombinase n=1 Tax=Spirosoma foliorum TaxID=2710596 RepID=A0A7G5GVA1_9BACT|nr:DDE-type integrase/transposase/recombinase [Spirosoma foliorum]QMW02793.1 DDE-type integrase/transposase/recombinase [Spirosoma foliorum]